MVRFGRLVGAAAAGISLLLLAGCEDRMVDEVAYPRAKPDRTVAAPMPKVPQHGLPVAAPYAYRPDPYRSNCALSRC
jgi:hypothetical protein